VSAANIKPSFFKRSLVRKLVLAKAYKDKAKEEYEAGNTVFASKNLGLSEYQVKLFENRVKTSRRVSPEDKAIFLEASAEIKEKIDEQIEVVNTNMCQESTLRVQINC
jgi:hypothetical protein